MEKSYTVTIKKLLQAGITWLEEERGRWFLWLPVAAVLGASIYFALPTEPEKTIVLVSLGAGILALALSYKKYLWRWRLLMLGLVLLSFANTAWQVKTDSTLLLKKDMGPVTVTGEIVAREARPEGVRLTLKNVAITGLPASETPQKIRLSVKPKFLEQLPPLGGRVTTSAMLQAPRGPALPEAYDFRRHAFLEGYGAVGYIVGRVAALERQPEDVETPVRLETARLKLEDKIYTVLKGDEAAIASALLTGDQAGISKAALDSMRASGLAHILSISGLHVGLMAGMVFFTLRFLLALIPGWALRYPIKKYAAVAALLAAVAYTVFVGAPVPAIRSAVMVSLVFIAILVDRLGLSLRLLAVAALVILAFAPHSVVMPSFQLSFAAMMALLAAFEVYTKKRLEKEHRWYDWVWDTLVGVVLSSVIATAATAPFIWYHFQQANLYGVVANALAMPVTSFVIMPAVVLSYIAWPLGFVHLPLLALGFGNKLLLDIAAWVASLPGASLHPSYLPMLALLPMVVGLFWLCLWQTRWRFMGLTGFALGFVVWWATPLPDVVVAGNGSMAAVRTQESYALKQLSGKPDKFVVELWAKYLGLTQFEDYNPDKVLASGCDGAGCVWNSNLALAFVPEAAFEACGQEGVILTPAQWRMTCRSARVVDRRALYRMKAIAVYERGDVSIAPVSSFVGERLWH